MPRARALAAASLAAALAVLPAGCADDSPPAQARGGRIAVTLDDYLIRPQRIRARAGRIVFQVTNRGAVGHTFHVFRGATDLTPSRTLLPGESATETATLAPGTYRMKCILGNHEELGMYGTLVVR